MFCKRGVLIRYAKSTRKHLWQSFFSLKLQVSDFGKDVLQQKHEKIILCLSTWKLKCPRLIFRNVTFKSHFGFCFGLLKSHIWCVMFSTDLFQHNFDFFLETHAPFSWDQKKNMFKEITGDLYYTYKYIFDELFT